MSLPKKIKILTIYHNDSVVFKNDVITPIFAGKSISRYDGSNKLLLNDDDGENISYKNKTYNELTAIYWAWKNYEKLSDPDYIGFMHYRRHFYIKKFFKNIPFIEVAQGENLKDYFSNTLGITRKSLNKILSKNDFIVSSPYYKNSIYDHYKSSHDINELIFANQIIQKKFPKYADSFEKYIKGHNAYFCNMFILPKDDFFEYCNYVFGVLEEFEKAYPNKRLYISERLTGSFIQYLIDKGRKPATIPTAFTIDKIENIDVAYHVAIESLDEIFISINSLLLHRKSNQNFNIYLIGSSEALNLATSSLDKLIKKYNFVNLLPVFQDETNSINNLEGVLKEIVLITERFPALDKFIMLSSQAVPINDIAPFYRNDVSEFYLCGVAEAVKKTKQNVNIEKINLGVLLVNAKKFRDTINAFLKTKTMIQKISYFFNEVSLKQKFVSCKYNFLLKNLTIRDGEVSFNRDYLKLVGEIDAQECFKSPIIINFEDTNFQFSDSSSDFSKIDTCRQKSSITVIVPVYNSEKFLEKCLDSVFSQTFKDISVICINDGSTDSSLKILQNYSAQHKNLYIFSQDNRGSAECRNLGLSYANSEFVCFLDSDDYYPASDILETLYNKSKSNNAIICGGSWSEITKNKNKTKVTTNFKKSSQSGYTFSKDSWISYSDYQFDYGYHRFIYNLDFLRKNKILFPPLSRFQDPPFFVRAMISAQNFYAIKKVTYCYRFENRIENVLKGRKLNDHLKGINDLLFLSIKHELPYLHIRNIIRLNEIDSLLYKKILNDGDISILILLIRAYVSINNQLFLSKKYPDVCMISSLQRIVSRKTIKRCKNEKSLIHRVIKKAHKLVRYIKMFGLKSMIDYLFLGKSQAYMNICQKNIKKPINKKIRN